MVTSISQSVYNQAQALNDAGDVVGAWEVLGNAGDMYATNAAEIVAQHNDPKPTNSYAIIADANWRMVAC